jgi:ribose-phosphate pyrophosphokinase
MVTLNLVYPEASDIKYKLSSFPDGQHQVTILDLFPFTGKDVTIKSRLNNWIDLEIIACTVASLRYLNPKSIHLYVPYVEGARSDRKFEVGSNNYLKDVICPIINSYEFNSVTVLDPHSDCLEMGINNFIKTDNKKLVKFALESIDNKNDAQSRTMFVSPDAGALKKIYDIAKHFKVDNVVTAAKVRNISTGEILKTELPPTNFEGIEQVIIIDDICDGGRTFIELAKAIKEAGYNGNIYLIVTHGIFSAGFLELSRYFNKIYCTNSYKDIIKETIIGSGVLVKNNLVKQLELFKNEI